MKPRTSFRLFALTMGLAGLAAGFLFSSKPVETSAAYEGKVFYLDCVLNSEIIESGWAPYLHGEKKDTDFILVGNGIYKLEAPITEKDEIRFKDESKTDQGFKVNLDTSRLQGMYDYAAVLEEKSGDLLGISAYGRYTEKQKNPGATYATQRIWLEEPKKQETAWPSQWCLGYEDQKGYAITAMESFAEAGYLFGDIPYACTSVDFLWMSNEPNHGYAVYQKTSVALSYGVCYRLEKGEVITTIVRGASASLLGKVVEGYLTLGKEPSNGTVTSTIQNVFMTWWEHKSATKEDLKIVKILDYTGYAANGNSYEGLEKTAPYSVYEKWSGLTNNAGIDPNTGQVRTGWSFGLTSPLTIAFILGGVLVLFVAAFAVVGRKVKR